MSNNILKMADKKNRVINDMVHSILDPFIHTIVAPKVGQHINAYFMIDITNIILQYLFTQIIVLEICNNMSEVWDHHTYSKNIQKKIISQRLLSELLAEMQNILPQHVVIMKQYISLTINIICCSTNSVNNTIPWDILFGSHIPPLLEQLGDKYVLLIADRAILGCTIASKLIDTSIEYNTSVEVIGTPALKNNNIYNKLPTVLQILVQTGTDFRLTIDRIPGTVKIQIPTGSIMNENEYEFKWSHDNNTYDGYVLLKDVDNNCIMYILVRQTGRYTIIFGAHFCELKMVDNKTVESLVSNTLASENINIDAKHILNQFDFNTLVVNELRRTYSDTSNDRPVMKNISEAIKRCVTEGHVP